MNILAILNNDISDTLAVESLMQAAIEILPEDLAIQLLEDSTDRSKSVGTFRVIGMFKGRAFGAPALAERQALLCTFAVAGAEDISALVYMGDIKPHTEHRIETRLKVRSIALPKLGQCFAVDDAIAALVFEYVDGLGSRITCGSVDTFNFYAYSTTKPCDIQQLVTLAEERRRLKLKKSLKVV